MIFISHELFEDPLYAWISTFFVPADLSFNRIFHDLFEVPSYMGGKEEMSILFKYFSQKHTR